MMLNEIGKIAEKCWQEIPMHFPDAILGDFFVMPNHIHGIVFLKMNDFVETKNFSSLPIPQDFSSLPIPQKINRPNGTSRTIGSIVRGFKIGVTKWTRQNTNIFEIWQSNYHDHIIRNENELQKISEYILQNPENWENDDNNIILKK